MKHISCKKLFFMLPLLSLQAILAWPPSDTEKAKLVLDVMNSGQSEPVKLNRYEHSYSLSVGEEEREIPNHMVSAPLQRMSPEQLAGFLQSNYITIKPYSDGSVALAEHGRIRGGGPGGGAAGWLGGYVAGEVAGKVVIMASGYAVLYGTKFVIGRFAGREAEAAFEEKMHSRMIPHLHEASETIAHVTGIAGALGGGIGGTAAPTP